jgi:hypothetical protein
LSSNSLNSQRHAVIQAQVLYRITRHLKLGDFKATRTDRVVGIAHITLAVTYLITALLVLAGFMMKLGLVSQHIISGDRSAQWPEPTCPLGYNGDFYLAWPPVCFEQKWRPLWTVIDIVDVILRVLFPIMLLFADGLMVSTTTSIGEPG